MIVMDLDALRCRGVRLLALSGWVWTAALLLFGAVGHLPNMMPAILLSAVANLLPTRVALKRRHDS